MTLPETTMSDILHFPLAAVVGADELKLALCLTAIDPKIGGVLIEGPRGMAKSTLARGLADLLASGQFVTLPLGATEERLVGTLDLDAALSQGRAQFSPGVLAKAHGGVLYVDEVNLLPDHLVDLLLDVAASGTNLVERDGISHRHPARFVLIGTMNPEEGELRPQLLDRFGLNVALSGQTLPAERGQIIRRRLDYDSDPLAFCAQWQTRQDALRQRCDQARQLLESIALDDQTLQTITERCFAADVDGMRADLVWLRAARAHAAWRGGREIEEQDIDAVAEFALRHRRRQLPLSQVPDQGQQPEPPTAQAPQGSTSTEQDEGNWGELSAQAMPSGARREVPSWPKKP